MSITFGGLATGMDTDSIVSALMEIERSPIERLEKDKAYFQNRLNAFSALDGKLKDFLGKAEAIDSVLELNSPGVKSSSEDYLSVSAGGNAQLGSYQISVEALAQQQKDVSQGFADKTASSFSTGTLSLTVGGATTDITIDAENNSLEGIATAINEADAGVSATIINDGTGATPYRLVLTGDSVADNFSLSGLGGELTMTTTQTAQQAHMIIDGIDVYSDSNSVDSSVPGLDIELLRAEPGVNTTINISSDKEGTEAKIKEFVDAYNGVISFFEEQKDAGWGNDSAFRSIKRQMQNLLVSPQGSGTYTSLAQLGFETQRDGTIVLNSSKLSAAMTDDYEAVVGLFAGAGGADGISTQFADYLESVTDSTDGVYASRKEGTDSNIRRTDMRIDTLEVRMEQKEKTLRAQFTAMEDLVSGLNAQGGYLLQQLAAMPTIGGGA